MKFLLRSWDVRSLLKKRVVAGVLTLYGSPLCCRDDALEYGMVGVTGGGYPVLVIVVVVVVVVVVVAGEGGGEG